MRLLLVAFLSVPFQAATASADSSISLRSGYFFDQTANELSNRYEAKDETPQASLLGVGLAYQFPKGSKYEDWRIALSAMWGRGNESFEDVDVIRQDDEIIVTRDINSTFQAFGGYRYEYTGLRTRAPNAFLQPAPGLPITAPAQLVRSTEGQVRHSVRTGFAMDVPIALDPVVSPESEHRASASLALVLATGQTSLSYLIDGGAAPGIQDTFIRARESDIFRMGPELTAGYRWHATDKTTLDLRYRGAFLFDSLSSSAQVNAVHGLTLALTYQFSGTGMGESGP